MFAWEDHTELVVTTLSTIMTNLLKAKPTDDKAEEEWTTALDGLVAKISSDSYSLASVKQLASDEEFQAFKGTIDTDVAMLGNLRPIAEVFLEKSARADAVSTVTAHLHGQSQVDETFKPHKQATETWGRLKKAVTAKAGANVKSQLQSLTSNHYFQMMLKVASALQELPTNPSTQASAEFIANCASMPKQASQGLLAIPDSAFVQMQARATQLAISHNASGGALKTKPHTFKHHDGRTIQMSMTELEIAAPLARWARMLASTLEQTRSEDIHAYGNDPVQNVFAQALGQLSNAAHFTIEIFEFESCGEALKKMLKTTASHVFVSYADWLSKIAVNHCDALQAAAKVILTELTSDEVFAKIEALGPEHFEQAIELLKEVQLIRKKTVAAELLEHDAVFNEVVERINEVNSSISTNWAHVLPEVSCPALVKMPSEATKVFQNVG